MSTETERRSPAAPLRVWLEWVAACAAACLVSVGIGVVGPWGLPALGLCMGAAQWLVLRRHVRGVTWRWIPATALAGPAAVAIVWGALLLAGAALHRLEPQSLWPSLFRAVGLPGVPVAGALAVLGQWAVLRGAVRSAGWWVPGGAAAAPSMTDVLQLMMRVPVLARLGEGGALRSPLLDALVDAALGGAQYGAITGFVLIWLHWRAVTEGRDAASAPEAQHTTGAIPRQAADDGGPPRRRSAPDPASEPWSLHWRHKHHGGCGIVSCPRRELAAALIAVLLLGGALVQASLPVAASPSDSAACAPEYGWTALAGPGPELTPERERLVALAAGWDAPGELYAGGFGGLYHSTDCGATWRRISVGPGTGERPRLGSTVSTLAADRAGTLYVGGSGEPMVVSPDRGATWWTTGLASSAVAAWSTSERVAYSVVHQLNLRGPTGVWRTSDGGATWEQRTALQAVGAMAVDADDPDVLYGADFERLLRSSDGGATWARRARLSTTISGVASAADGSRLWAATVDGGLHRSVDRGLSWEAVADSPYDGHLIALSASPHERRIVFGLSAEGQLWAYRDTDQPTAPAVPAVPESAAVPATPAGRALRLPRTGSGAAGTPAAPHAR